MSIFIRFYLMLLSFYAKVDFLWIIQLILITP